MQTANVNLPITITVRHEEVTDSLREYVNKKIETLHLDYPRIIEAKALSSRMLPRMRAWVPRRR